SRLTPSYAADARLLVGPINADAATLQAAGQLSRTYADLATSRPVIERAAANAGVTSSFTKLQSDVSASANEITRVVDVRVELKDAAQASALANAVGERLIQLSSTTARQVGGAVDALVAQADVSRLPA